MAKVVYSDGQRVTNVVAPASIEDMIRAMADPTVSVVDDSTNVSVGDPYDAKSAQVNAVGQAALQVLYRHELLIRQLIRTCRDVPAANTAANSEGLPASANVPDITFQQALAAFKALIP